MKTLDKVLQYTDSATVQLTDEFKDLISKELVLGQTRYMCRYGTLSDGHERITKAQIYYGAIKEMWTIRTNMIQMKALALKEQASLLDAQEKMETAKTEQEKLRAQADLMLAEQGLANCLVSVQDQTRMLDEYNRVRLELKDEIQAKYPNGIEQAEQDNWSAVAEYRAKNRSVMHNQSLNHVPLDPLKKAELGLQLDAPEMTSWLSGLEKEAILQIANGNISKFIAMAKQHQAKQIGEAPPCETL